MVPLTYKYTIMLAYNTWITSVRSFRLIFRLHNVTKKTRITYHLSIWEDVYDIHTKVGNLQ